MTEIVIRMLQDLRAHMERIDARFDKMEARFELRFEQIDSRFQVIESTLLNLAEQNRFIVRHLKSTSDQLRQHEVRITRLEDEQS